MSLDKAILSGKEKRKLYRGGKSIDPTCRNHKGCPWCVNSRKHKYRKREQSAEDDFKEFMMGL